MKNINKNNVTLNLIQGLQREFLSLRNGVRGRSRIKYGMTTNFMSGLHLTYKRQSAFTLIELLVVVLIIGILAAAALPQYTLAVNKTRFANLRAMATSFVTAAQAYHLANNAWPATFDELALDLPAGFEIITASHNRNYDCGQNDDMFCCIVPNAGSAAASISCSRKDKSFTYTFRPDVNDQYCVANDNDANAKKLCKAITKRNGVVQWGIYTPTGYETSNRRFYLMP